MVIEPNKRDNLTFVRDERVIQGILCGPYIPTQDRHWVVADQIGNIDQVWCCSDTIGFSGKIEIVHGNKSLALTNSISVWVQWHCFLNKVCPIKNVSVQARSVRRHGRVLFLVRKTHCLRNASGRKSAIPFMYSNIGEGHASGTRLFQFIDVFTCTLAVLYHSKQLKIRLQCVALGYVPLISLLILVCTQLPSHLFLQ